MADNAASIPSTRKEQKKEWLAAANAPRSEQPKVFSGRTLVNTETRWNRVCYFRKKQHDIVVPALAKTAEDAIIYEILVSCPDDARKTWSSGTLHEPEHGVLMRALTRENKEKGGDYATLQFSNGTPCIYVGKRGGSPREKFQSVKAKIAFNLLAPADAQSVAADIRWFVVCHKVLPRAALGGGGRHPPSQAIGSLLAALQEKKEEKKAGLEELLEKKEGLEALLAALRGAKS